MLICHLQCSVDAVVFFLWNWIARSRTHIKRSRPFSPVTVPVTLIICDSSIPQFPRILSTLCPVYYAPWTARTSDACLWPQPHNGFSTLFSCLETAQQQWPCDHRKSVLEQQRKYLTVVLFARFVCSRLLLRIFILKQKQEKTSAYKNNTSPNWPSLQDRGCLGGIIVCNHLN